MPTTVKILHKVENNGFDQDTRDEVLRGLTNGAYYLAGEIEVLASVSYENEDCRADYSDVLEAAYVDSQNDTHANYVETDDGDVIGTFQELVEEFGTPEEAEKEVARYNAKVLPACWNEQFPQRSTSVGDLVVVDDGVYQVGRGGFSGRLVGLGLLARHKGVRLAINPNAINEDFDALLTD